MTTQRDSQQSTPPDAFDVWLSHVGRYIVNPIVDLSKKSFKAAWRGIRNQIRHRKSIQHRRGIAQHHRNCKTPSGSTRKRSR